jgi:hypothetical protein
MTQHNIDLWRRIRAPFQLPQCIHHCTLCDWESIDCDVAGCLVCGKLHECKDAMHCPLVVHEGRHVCEITGYYTRRNVFVDDEFVDTVTNLCSYSGKTLQTISRHTIDTLVNHILCSDQARQSLEQEMVRRELKLRNCFIKQAKAMKFKRQSLNVLDLCTQVAHAMSSTRRPRIMNSSQLSSLRRVCVSYIDFFAAIFFERFHVIIPNSKLNGFVVGLLYLMRHGLIMHGNVIVVPHVPELHHVLPSENQIKTVFQMSTKLLTEVENCIKITLKRVTRYKLVDVGFKTI